MCVCARPGASQINKQYNKIENKQPSQERLHEKEKKKNHVHLNESDRTRVNLWSLTGAEAEERMEKWATRTE